MAELNFVLVLPLEEFRGVSKNNFLIDVNICTYGESKGN